MDRRFLAAIGLMMVVVLAPTLLFKRTPRPAPAAGAPPTVGAEAAPSPEGSVAGGTPTHALLDRGTTLSPRVGAESGRCGTADTGCAWERIA